jgi:hypothetical protein
VPLITALVVDVSVVERTGRAGELIVYGDRLDVYEIAVFDAVIVKSTPMNVVPVAIVRTPVAAFIVTPPTVGVYAHTTGAARASEFVNESVTGAAVALTICGDAAPATMTGFAGALTKKLRVFVTLIAAFDARTTKFDSRKYWFAPTVTTPVPLLIETPPDCGLVGRSHTTGAASGMSFVNVNVFAVLVTSTV